jgi:hypothetical protein
MPATALQTFKAQFFRALSHPVRIKILEILIGGDRSVQELQEALNWTSPLCRSSSPFAQPGIVTSEKKGLRCATLAGPRHRGSAGRGPPHLQQPFGEHARDAPRAAAKAESVVTAPSCSHPTICKYVCIMLPPHLSDAVGARSEQTAGHQRRTWFREPASARCSSHRRANDRAGILTDDVKTRRPEGYGFGV